MATNTKKNVSCVVNVSRQGLAVCGPGIEGVVQTAFPAGLMTDLDISNLAGLTELVKSFVTANRMGSRELILVFAADTYFEKDLLGKNDEEKAKEVQEFIDSVPLSNPSSKLFKVGDDKYKIVVINRRLYESLRTAFESVGFGVVAVVPELALGQFGVVGSGFNINACRVILKSWNHIVADSFIGSNVVVEDDNWVNHHKKEAAILAVVGMLVGILGVGLVVWQTIATRNAAIAKAKARIAQTAHVQTAEASPTPTPSPETTSVASASANLADYSVQILNTTGITGQAAKVQDLLKAEGFAKISIGTSDQNSKSLVVVADKVPTEVRDKIKKVLTPLIGTVSIVENSQAQFDILITLGKTNP